MGAVECIGATIGGDLTDKAWKAARQAYRDWKKGRSIRLGVAIDSKGRTQMLVEARGVLDGTIYESMAEDVESIFLSGRFLADESFADYADVILDNEDKEVVFCVIDEEQGEALFGEFSFDGYAIELWPGLYSLYAFIVDPDEDTMLAIGYPDWGDLQDPNPVELEGSGQMSLDFILFEVEDDYD